MPEIIIDKDGNVTAKSYIKVTRQYTCNKGTLSTLTLDWPEGVTVNGAINVNVVCPCCGEQVVIPTGTHKVENGILITE